MRWNMVCCKGRVTPFDCISLTLCSPYWGYDLGMTIAMQHPPAAIDSEAHTLHAHRRTAIDMIATMRARVVRCALFGTYVLRDNPVSPETETTRAHWCDLLREQFLEMEQTVQMLTGKHPDNGIPRDVCNWISGIADQNPEHIKSILSMHAMTQNIVTALDSDAKGLDAALKKHFKFGREVFFHAVTNICDALWSQLDIARHKEVQGAHEAAKAIDVTLRRLERIGKHVRLVSLNASVEAARVGEEGKGLGVIAVEFKALAEEIQRLAVTAREDIAAFSVANR